MAIVRAAKRKNYTRISNKILNDPTISLKAKGLWTLLMSKPSDWEITVKGTATLTKERPDALSTIFKELEGAGYLKRHVVSHGKGDIKTVCTLFNSSKPELKKELLESILSNAIPSDKSLAYILPEPFDTVVKINKSARKERSDDNSDSNKIHGWG